MSILAATMAGSAYRGILSEATSLWQAKNYAGTGAWLDERGSADFQLGSTSGDDANDPQWLPFSTSQNPFGPGVKYVYIPDVSGNYASVPDSVDVDITGDLTLIMRMSVSSWAPGTFFASAAKLNTVGDQRSFRIGISATGEISWAHSADGINNLPTASTTPTGFTDGEAGWIGVTLDVDNGAGGHDVKFWVSTTDTNNPDEAIWTQLGDTVTTAGTTSIFNSNTPFVVGGTNVATTNLMNFSASRVQLYSGIRDLSSSSGGDLVADFNPNNATVNSTQTMMADTGDGLIWTFTRSSSGRKLAVVDRDKFVLGTDDRFEMDSTASTTMPWLGDEQPFTIVNLFRYHGTTIGGGRIIFGSGRAGVTNVGGVSICADFSSRIRMHIADGSSGIGSTANAISSYTSHSANYAVTYDPANESMRTIASNSNGAVITNQLVTSLSDLGTISNNTPVRIGWQSVDNGYTDMEFVAAAVFNRVLTADEMQQAMKELSEQPPTYYVEDSFNGPNNEAVSARASDVGGGVWGSVGTTAPLLDGSGAVKISGGSGNTSARVLMPNGNNKVLINGLGGSGGSVTSRWIAPTVRHTNESNHIQAFVRASDDLVILRKRVSGTYTTLASVATSGLSNSVAWNVELQIVDDFVEVWINGVSTLTHTLSGADYSAFPNTNAGVGFMMNGFDTTKMNYFRAEST